jgi:periplasmic protein TonB
MSLVDPGRLDAPTAVARATSRTTIVVSLVAHAAVIVVAVVVPLFAQVQLPSPSHPIEAYIRAAAYREVPMPSAPGRPHPADSTPVPATPDVAVHDVAAPTEAPTTIASGEASSPPPPGVVSGGVPGAGLSSTTLGLPAPPALDPPLPPPAPAGPRRVGGDISAPRKLRHVAPTYPPIAAQARISGTVILDATIAESGEVVNVRVLRSVPLLDAAAIDAVRQWRYDPPRLNGTPVSVLLTVTVQFAL